MKRLLPALVVVIVLALIAGAGGAWLGARYIIAHDEPPSIHQLVHKDLKLSPDQEQRIEALEDEFAGRRKAREAELRQANAQLALAIEAQHTYTPEVQAAIERFHAAMGALQEETVRHVLAMREVLTPDQAVKFDARVKEALTDQAP